ncbi:MAG: amidohydrolase family protein [Planctomycetes bacterium]|nr:amidohydrolase family protein [Planctomycetota bacterium]
MTTDLAQHIEALRVVNTHEHQIKEDPWRASGPTDILQELFAHYERGDLVSAGQPVTLADELTNPATASLKTRWNKLRPHWELIQYTGYGEAIRIHAKLLYGIDELDLASLTAAQPRIAAYRKPGQRLHLLRDVANLDHIQTDDFCWPCLPDASGPDFFFYDLSMAEFAYGNIDVEAIARETGYTVTNLSLLRQAIAALFAKYAPVAVAVKSQHAYGRTLAWRERPLNEAVAALEEVLRHGDKASADARLCIGDWCIGQAAEQCARHNLPFKIHTGYYAGTGYMRLNRIPAGNLCELLIKYPRTRFVLMHIAYPYSDEMLAIVKHFPNAFVDLCWAWSIDPYSTMDFVRRFLHAVPVNKMFGYGGDTFWPTRGVAYAAQMRRWMTRALQAEVDAGDLTERRAIAVADRFLRLNQLDVFDMAAKRRAVAAAMKKNAPVPVKRGTPRKTGSRR